MTAETVGKNVPSSAPDKADMLLLRPTGSLRRMVLAEASAPSASEAMPCVTARQGGDKQ